ncbi:MAG: hypothetical protein Q9195_000496 [Heterodermia aff. obscurata]
MGKKNKSLTQAEIWDDSALLESWDEALEEYKLYHSIHARGERIEDVLRSAEAADLESSNKKDGISAARDLTDGTKTDDLEDVQDEALKNLMMSWYYAGYYTGLYESQQKVVRK